jgi:predicted nucleotidyltransferase component of viral defense system
LLFDLWFDVPHRPTHDADFLGFGSAEIPHVEALFRDICRIEVDDGIVFDPDSVKAAEIRKEANYAGRSRDLDGNARQVLAAQYKLTSASEMPSCPAPMKLIIRFILAEMPAPHLRVYPRYTVVAEKLEALTSLGMLNSRMKDYFDLWVLARYTDFNGAVLSQAVAATFDRRRTAIPNDVPIGLSDEFITDAQKEKQWQAFLRKNAIDSMSLASVTADLRAFLLPVLATVAAKGRLNVNWRAGESWQ